MKSPVVKFLLVLLVLALAAVGVYGYFNCQFGHAWKDADCVTAKTCRNCGVTEGEPLGHDWREATCTSRMTCQNCGQQEGELGHHWLEATCLAPMTCTLCGQTDGEPGDHDWAEEHRIQLMAKTGTIHRTCMLCEAEEDEDADAAVAVGDYVVLGTYPMMESGFPGYLEWQVLDVQDGKALLLSRYILSGGTYHDSSKPQKGVTWETCTIRQWLNSKFLNFAFRENEQALIAVTTVKNDGDHVYSQWRISGGNDTQDRIFLLSVAEARDYLGADFGKTSEEAIAISTPYARMPGPEQVRRVDENNHVIYETDWLLRSPVHEREIVIVSEAGALATYPSDWVSGVRPAMWVNLE